MTEMHELARIEEQGWKALSSAGDAAREFYGSLLADDALMLFPGGLLIEGKEPILGSMGDRPWKSFRLEDLRVLPLSEEVGVVVYRVMAEREGRDTYEALISSTYARRGGEWTLVVHQQTPV
jgi:ketosteroid isomerase-like protein